MSASPLASPTRVTRLLALIVGALAACGGNRGSPAPAPVRYAFGLDYADPAGAGWRLVRDPASTPTRLLLDLVGPAGLKTRGAGLNLQASDELLFATFASGLPVEDLGVYALGRAGQDEPQPVAMNGGLKPGNVLTVGVFQKDRAQGAKDSGAPLLRIALVLNPVVAVVQDSTLPLTVLKARAIPEDIGDPYDDAGSLHKKMRMSDLDVAVGVLTAR